MRMCHFLHKKFIKSTYICDIEQLILHTRERERDVEKNVTLFEKHFTCFLIKMKKNNFMYLMLYFLKNKFITEPQTCFLLAF